MMKLNKLNLEELCDLANTLNGIVSAGASLELMGFAPSFDLTPGQEVTIRTGHKMPVAGPMGAFAYQGLDFGGLDRSMIVEIGYPTGAKPAQTGTGPDAPAGESAGGGVRDTAAPGCEAVQNLAEAAPVHTGAQDEGIASKPAKSPAGEAPSPGGGLVSGPLSEAEKDRILFLDQQGVGPQTIAQILCRRKNIVSCFLTLQAKKAEADAPKANTDTTQPDPDIIPEQTSGTSSPVGGDDEGGNGAQDVAAPAPVAPKPAPVARKPALVARKLLPAVAAVPKSATPETDGLREHLSTLPHKNGWTLDNDAELMRLSCLGWQFNAIETDLALQGAKARFELLTDSRSYPRQKVAAALKVMQGEAAAALKAMQAEAARQSLLAAQQAAAQTTNTDQTAEG